MRSCQTAAHATVSFDPLQTRYQFEYRPARYAEHL